VCIGFRACVKDVCMEGMKMLEEEKETRAPDMYKVSCGEFPKDDELSLYDGFCDHWCLKIGIKSSN